MMMDSGEVGSMQREKSGDSGKEDSDCMGEELVADIESRKTMPLG